MRPLASVTSELVALAREGHLAAFIDRARSLPAADLGEVLALLPPRDRIQFVSALPARLAAHAIIEMPAESHPASILEELVPQAGARLVAELADDDATDLLGRLDAGRRQQILAALGNPLTLDQLLRYDATTAGGRMTSHVVVVGELDSAALAIESVRRQAAALGDLSEIFVIDSARRLTGVLSVQQLLLAPTGSLVRDTMSPATVRIGPTEDQQVAARIIARYNLTSIPVVDPLGRLLGRVTADDVREVTVNDAIDDLMRFGGVSPRETPQVAWSVSLRSRLPSLYVNLFTAFGAAAVVYFFKGTVQRVITLAVWMPVVAGVGGNAGTQSLATSVRRLMHQPGAAARWRGVVGREALIGAANGVALGLVVAIVAVLLGESWKLGVVVLLAMVANLIVAGVTGAAIPLLLKSFGRDPSLASPVMVTALVDAFGFALLLGLASWLLL